MHDSYHDSYHDSSTTFSDKKRARINLTLLG